MIQLFAGNRPYSIFLLPLLIFGFHVFNHAHFAGTSPEFLDFGMWGRLEKPITSNALLWLEGLSGLLVFAQAVLLNFIYNTYEFQERNTYVVSFAFVVLSSFFSSFYLLEGMSIGLIFLTMVFYQFFKLNQNESSNHAIFNGAFFLGLSITCYPPLLIGLPFFASMYLIGRPWNLRSFIVFLLGVGVALFYGVMYRLFYHLPLGVYWPKGHSFLFQSTLANYVVLSALIVTGVFSLMGLRERIKTASNRLKKKFQMIGFSLVALLTAFFCEGFLYTGSPKMHLFLVPLCLLFAFPLLQKRMRFATSILVYIFLIYNILKFL
jgi:hypothetical protein